MPLLPDILSDIVKGFIAPFNPIKVEDYSHPGDYQAQIEMENQAQLLDMTDALIPADAKIPFWRSYPFPLLQLYNQALTPQFQSRRAIIKNPHRKKMIIQNDSRFPIQIYSQSFTPTENQATGLSPTSYFVIAAGYTYDKLEYWTDELWVAISPASTGTQPIPTALDVLIIMELIQP